MPKLNKKKIIEVIQKDANLKGHYFGHNEGDACVIGGLSIGANIDRDLKEKIRMFSNCAIIGTDFEAIKQLRQLIQDIYGLTYKQQMQLQCINDQWDDVEDRRKQLINAVNAMKDEIEVANETNRLEIKTVISK